MKTSKRIIVYDFFQVISADPFSDFHIPYKTFEDLEQFENNLQCVRGVFKELLEKSDLGNLWRGLDKKFNQMIVEDWTKCMDKKYKHEKFV